AELETDHPGAYDAEPLRRLGELERTGRVDDPLAVELRDRQLDRHGPGRDHDVLRFEHLLAVRPVHLHASAFEETPMALDRRDTGGLEERVDAGRQLLHDRALALEHLADIDAERPDGDAVRGELRLRTVIELGRLEQRLRRDAADVQARAAERTS